MPEQIDKKLIEEELKTKYIDYAMSVIVGRALPNVKDGLKPVHRRILYAMLSEGLLSNKRYSKCAGIVGEVLKKYHPHGDMAVYDSLVRMAQDFSLRYPLIDGHGNFGSVDGDPAAAYRYTEARLSKIAEELLTDIDQNTVKFIPNYDGSVNEPLVLPSKFPNLLVNGSSGIAVGMATNIPPHNMGEVIDAIIHLIDHGPGTSVDELMRFVKGPDFPTGGLICGVKGIHEAYKTGRGKIILRAKAEIQDKKDKKQIIITEIPYQVNKSELIIHIVDLVKNKRVEGISDIRDESDRKGMRIVIELRKSANSEVILNQLYKHSSLEITFGAVMIALVDNIPKILNLKDIMHNYILHRKEVVIKRTQFQLEKAEKRSHIITGLLIALRNIDPVVRLIKASKNPEMALKGLMDKYKLSKIQAQAILDMRLQRLTSLEQDKLRKEHQDTLKFIAELKAILESTKKVFEIIKKELLEIKEKYNDARKTEVLEGFESLEMEDLIKKEDIVITLSHEGYAKKLPLETYKQQRRGGTGIIASTAKEEDFLEKLFITSTHDTLLFFTSKGRLFAKKAYYLPTANRYAKGTPIVNVLKLEKDEKVTALIPVDKFDDKRFLFMITKRGYVKKTVLSAFARPRQTGIIALTLENDELVDVLLTDGKQQVLIATGKGMAVKFHEKNVRPMGRTARGVRGIKLVKDKVVGMAIANDMATLLTVTENGYGKKTPISDYRLINRGGKGVINIKTSQRNGKVIGIKTVMDKDELMFISAKGVMIRTSAKNISTIGRNTQGVRVMRLRGEDKVIAVARVLTEIPNGNNKEVKQSQPDQ